MNKTRYSATEFGGNKPMNIRPSGTLKITYRILVGNKMFFRARFVYKSVNVNPGLKVNHGFCFFRLNFRC